MSFVKTSEQVEKMKASGIILGQCLDMLVEKAQPGVSGKYLDALAEEFIKDNNALPAFKNYSGGAGLPGFPASICFSRNYVLVHGIPNEKDVIQEGDIITIDCGLSIEGWFADAARLFGVGKISTEDSEHMTATEDALRAGIDACRVGNRLGDICHSIQKSIGLSRFYNVVQFCGHAIGQQMHESPQVPNFGKANIGPRLQEGVVICLEPMLLAKKVGIGVLPDRWTIVTLDQTKATHIEEMILITKSGPEILTNVKIKSL